MTVTAVTASSPPACTEDDKGDDMPVNDDEVDVVDDESPGTEMVDLAMLANCAADAEVTGHHGTEPGPQRTEPTSAVSSARELLALETTVTAFSPSTHTAVTATRKTVIGDATVETEPDTTEQQNGMTSRVTGWCNGDSVRDVGSMTFVRADTLGQMPHGRWKSSIAMGVTSGISWDAASAGGTEHGWTARTFTDDSGTSIGMTRFRLTDMVHIGTGEELISKLTNMMPGTRVERRTSSSGVTSHLARSDRRVDMRSVLASVGLNVTNTNPMAHHLLQSFITNTTTVATTPTHRDENNAILVQLRGSKEVLVHPPAQSLPGCPAAIFANATLTDSRWLDVDPFELSKAYSSKWVKVVMVPGDVVVMPKLWWHAVRSTPGSVAISVPIQLEEISERTTWH